MAITINDLIKQYQDMISREESTIEAQDGLPGLYYDANKVRECENRINKYKEIIALLSEHNVDNTIDAHINAMYSHLNSVREQVESMNSALHKKDKSTKPQNSRYNVIQGITNMYDLRDYPHREYYISRYILTRTYGLRLSYNESTSSDYGSSPVPLFSDDKYNYDQFNPNNWASGMDTLKYIILELVRLGFINNKPRLSDDEAPTMIYAAYTDITAYSICYNRVNGEYLTDTSRHDVWITEYACADNGGIYTINDCREVYHMMWYGNQNKIETITLDDKPITMNDYVRITNIVLDVLIYLMGPDALNTDRDMKRLFHGTLNIATECLNEIGRG